jgi:glutaredoxin
MIPLFVKRLSAVLVLLCTATLPTTGCKQKSPQQGEEPASAAPKSNELPPLELRDDTPNLLLTWIDDKGDFHVVMKPADVPEARRQNVRVVVTDRTDGTGSLVYVADLSKKEQNGGYPVKTMSRNEWDELGASLRKARLEALAPPASGAASASAAPGTPAAPSAAPRKPGASKVVAIIYGAEWCKPCHDAARYLKQRGVTVIEKDIEASEATAAELKRKLDRANMSGASIPIIDVMGQLLVGYSPRALDRAITTAENAKPL